MELITIRELNKLKRKYGYEYRNNSIFRPIILCNRILYKKYDDLNYKIISANELI